MPPTDLDLDRMRNEMLGYLRQAGLPVFYGLGGPDEENFTFWDTRGYPDWRQFVDVAKESGARLLVFSSSALDEADLDMALEHLEETTIDADERHQFQERISGLRRKEGQAAWVRIAYEHEGRWFAYERIAPWYDEFRDMMEEINSYLPDVEEDEDNSPGFYSPN